VGTPAWAEINQRFQRYSSNVEFSHSSTAWWY
jgi:hypothetical protein